MKRNNFNSVELFDLTASDYVNTDNTLKGFYLDLFGERKSIKYIGTFISKVITAFGSLIVLAYVIYVSMDTFSYKKD